MKEEMRTFGYLCPQCGKTVMGICGGYQMMGTEVADPGGVEGTPARLSGLGLLPVHTVIGREKVTRQVEFRFRGSGTLCRGYEIHMGRTVADEAGQTFVPLNRLGQPTGVTSTTVAWGLTSMAFWTTLLSWISFWLLIRRRWPAGPRRTMQTTKKGNTIFWLPMCGGIWIW